MLLALMDGRIRPASELARLAHVTKSTASEHLAKLVAGRLVSVAPHGRFRYYRLADPRLAEALETLATIAPPRRMESLQERHHDSAIRQARLCYDHLAGTLGVRITEAMVAEGALTREDRAFRLTGGGETMLGDLGIDIEALRRRRRLVGRACLDWSERRYHLAGPLGVALASRLLALEWIERAPQTRALRVTNAGRRAFWRRFGVRLV
jgi:hypothetical protein